MNLGSPAVPEYDCQIVWDVRLARCDKMESSFCCIVTSLACILERACSREVILSFSMEGIGSFAGDEVSKMSEEESGAGKYTECVESVLGL